MVGLADPGGLMQEADLDLVGAAFLLVGCGPDGEGVVRGWQARLEGRPVTALVEDGPVDPARFAAALAELHVGARVLLAGPRAAVWPLRAVADRAGLLPEEVAVVLADGTADAPVFCSPCGAVQPLLAAPGDVATCPGCGLALDVVDQSSEHLGAWLAVPVDPDVPDGTAGAEDGS